jgi:hypothetical protein
LAIAFVSILKQRIVKINKQIKNMKNSICYLALLICVGNLNAQIQVNLPENPQITPVTPAIRGYNLGDFDYLPWDEVDSPVFRQEFAGLLPGIIRWPGGTGGNNYVWQDYINDSTRFHLVNAAEFTHDLDIGLQYMANYGNSSASETADFIRLCNSTEPYWQSRRDSLFGNPDPVNVKICEIGNENNFTHAWVSAWFGRAINEKIYFRDSSYIDFPHFYADSLYFYGGDIWRGGWVVPKTIMVHGHYTSAILGESYVIQPGDADTLIIPVSYPKIGNDSIYVWAVDTVLTPVQVDSMEIQEMYNLITEPYYLLDTNSFTILGDTAVMVYPPILMNPGKLIYIEYQSVGHDGAFAFRDSIKEADATVQVGYSVWPNDSLFSQSYFRNDFVQSPPDFIIRHTYPSARDIQWLADGNYFSEIPYLPQQLVQSVISGQDYIDSVTTDLGLTERFGIAITEWSYANSECDTCKMYLFDGITGAVNTVMFAASYMEAMHNSSINLVALNFFPLVKKWGSGGIYNIDPTLEFVTSRAHAMRMLSNTIGTNFFTIDSASIVNNPVIEILTTPLYPSPGTPIVIDTISIHAVKMWGGIDSLHNDYSLLLINQDDSLAHSVKFYVPTRWSADFVYVEQMTGIPDNNIYNLETETLAMVNDSVQIMLPAFSLTALRFQSNPTGVKEVDNKTDFTVYPNPFNEATTLEITNLQNQNY